MGQTKQKWYSEDIVSLGIDHAIRHIGVVAISSPSEIIHQAVIKPKLEDGIERLKEIYDSIKEAIDKIKPNIVVLEGYAFNKPFQAHQIGEIGGIIKLLCAIKKQQVVTVPPKRVKIFATGSGNATKDLVLLSVYKNFGQEFKNSDLADAYVLALIGYCKLKPNAIKLNKQQKNVLDGIILS